MDKPSVCFLFLFVFITNWPQLCYQAGLQEQALYIPADSRYQRQVDDDVVVEKVLKRAVKLQLKPCKQLVFKAI